ncbi:GntR family transcriptional regulator [Saccharothrix sp. S26]|uniref:GntR family transcriptional regulator n=1 Tax=Saccharothrix sp. S26 TaxID=2907215 RepID=UPI001F302B26|nr:GntR family transcriptional regulator [Saccharothrix sp. S26]MCE6999650.1 GntR family transcriptional regulator [Saccharothrix sp. S26]
MTRIVVDPDSGVAPWRQVRDQLVHLIRAGELPVGTPLPPIRQLARDLGLSVGTVARGYRELEAAGVLETARRRGTVVASVPHGDAGTAAALTEAAAEYVARAGALGVDRHDAVQAILHAYRDDEAAVR